MSRQSRTYEAAGRRPGARACPARHEAGSRHRLDRAPFRRSASATRSKEVSRSSACATSKATERQARAARRAAGDAGRIPELDLTVDGADEVDAELRLIKGGGGALLREKIVAAASRRMVVIADASKRVAQLGAFPLPVEVVPFGLAATRPAHRARARGARPRGPMRLRRRATRLFVTDGGHYILDCAFGAIADPEALAAALASFPASSSTGCSSAWRAPRSSPARPASSCSARSTEIQSPEERDIVSFPMIKASFAACFVLALGAATAAAAGTSTPAPQPSPPRPPRRPPRPRPRSATRRRSSTISA